MDKWDDMATCCREVCEFGVVSRLEGVAILSSLNALQNTIFGVRMFLATRLEGQWRGDGLPRMQAGVKCIPAFGHPVKGDIILPCNHFLHQYIET